MTRTYNDTTSTMNASLPAWGDQISPDVTTAAQTSAASGGLAVHPTGRFVAMVHNTSPYLEIWEFDSETGAWGDRVANPSALPSNALSSVAWHPSGNFIVMGGGAGGSDNSFVYAFDAVQGTIGDRKDSFEAANPNDMAFSPCGDYLAVATGTGKIYSFNTGTGVVGSAVVTAAFSTESTFAVAWSHGYEYGTTDDIVYIAWAHGEGPTGEFIHAFPFNRTLETLGSSMSLPDQPNLTDAIGSGVAWASSDRALAGLVADEGSVIAVWEFDPIGSQVRGRYAHEPNTDGAFYLAWLPDDGGIATGDGTSDLLLWAIDHEDRKITNRIVIDLTERPSGLPRGIAIGAGPDGLAFAFASHTVSPYIDAWPVITNTPFDGTYAVLSGTMLPGVIEEDITGGDRTIVMKLLGDTFVSEVGGNNTITDDLIAGLIGDDTDGNGWNDRVTITRSDVTRRGVNQVEISVPAAANYSVTDTETVTASASSSTLARSLASVDALNQFTVAVNEIAEGRASSQIILQTNRHMVWITPEIGLQFYVNAGGDIVSRQTVDGGKTWQQPVLRTEGADVVALDVYFERWSDPDAQNVIHLLWGDKTANEFRYQRLWHQTLPIASLEISVLFPRPIETVASGISVDFASASVQAACTLAKPPWSVGVYAVYHGTKDGNENWAFRAPNIGWLELSAPGGGPHTSADLDMPVLWPSGTAADFELLLLFWDVDANAIKSRTYDALAGTWSGVNTVSSNMVANVDEFLQWSSAYRMSDGHTLLTAWEDKAEAIAKALKAWDVDGATVTAEDNVISTTHAATCTVAIDQGTEGVYVAYGRSTETTPSTSELSVFYKTWEMWDAGQTSWGPEKATSGSLDDDVKLLVSDPGSSERGRWAPVWWTADDGVFASNDQNSVKVNVSWWLAVPMAAKITTSWTSVGPPFTHDGDDLDIADLPTLEPPVTPVIQRGWKTAFADGQIKITSNEEDGNCSAAGDRRDIRYQYYTDDGRLLANGETARALHISSSLQPEDLNKLKPSGFQIGTQVHQDNDGSTCPTYGGPHLHWEPPGVLRGPARASLDDADTRPDTWAKPGLWTDSDVSTELDEVDPATDFVAVIIED